MSTQMGTYDTSRMYRSGSHTIHDDKWALPALPAEVGRMMQSLEHRSAFVASSLRPAASAVVAYSEYLLSVAELPRDQQAVLDLLRGQARTILAGIGRLAADDTAGDTDAGGLTEDAFGVEDRPIA